VNCAIVGTLLLCGGNGLVNYAEQTVSSGMAGGGRSASMPLFAALFAGWFGHWPFRGAIFSDSRSDSAAWCC
jgi:hypothetical protein